MRIEIDRTGDKAMVQTKADPVMLAVARSLEGHRRWLKTGGLQIEASQSNICAILAAFPEAEVIDNREAHGEPQPLAEEFFEGRGPYRSLTSPYDHQTAALNKARPVLLHSADVVRGFALFMEQGTGKTKTAIDLAGELWCADQIDAVLVLAKKGVHRQWVESELPTHCGVGYRAAFWVAAKAVVPDELFDPGELKVFSINWDGAKTPKGKRACLEFVTAHKGRVLIVGDETQEIKNARSARWKAASEIAREAGQPARRLALTGTPIAKDLTDEWAQLKWLDEDILGIRYVSAFRNEYCLMGGFEGKVVVGQKNMDRFRQRVDPFTFRATKDQLGILPKSYRQWKFEMAPEQREKIRELKQTLETQIDSGEIVSAANAAVALSKIQQVSNGFITDEDGKAHTLMPHAKMPRIAALMEVLDAYEGPTIVWARFRRDMAIIEDVFDGSGISYVTYHGGTPDKERAENVERFLNGEARVFLSNPQAGGTGLNLQTGGCTHAVYYSNSYNAIDRWQSEDRIHRIGTKGAVVYTDLIAKGGLDAAILNNLKRKQGIADLALGDIRKILEEM